MELIMNKNLSPAAIEPSFIGFSKDGSPILRIGNIIYKEDYDTDTLRPLQDEELNEEFSFDDSFPDDYQAEESAIRIYDPDEGILEAD